MNFKRWKLMNEVGDVDTGGSDVVVDTKVIQSPTDKPEDVVVDTKVIQKDDKTDTTDKSDKKPDVKTDAKTDVKADAKTDTKTDDKKEEKPKANWPENWRDLAAKGDEKLLKRLGRYASPEAAIEALIAAQNKISSGEYKTALPKNATPEELANWRKDNGIPEKAEDYDLTFDSGLVIGDQDKPMVEGFLKVAHDRNQDNDSVKATLEWYYKEQERLTNERFDQDEKDSKTAIGDLAAEYGAEYRKNMVAVENLLTQFPEDVRDLFKAGRLANGKAIFNEPKIIRAFIAMAREVNPASTVVGAGAGDPMKSIQDEMKSIESKMGTPAYVKDEKMQQRYRELVEANEKMQKRA